MSKDVWLISDTHFGHKNILSFRDRESGNLVRPGFDSVDEMNEYMVTRWNECIKPGDSVYHLGDVFFGPKDEFLPLWKRLNGSKKLVVGNHDDIKYFAKNELVTKVYMWKQLPEFHITLSHVPLHESQLYRVAPPGHKSGTNVHGHIHDSPSPSGPYVCVCVEHTGYTPVNLEELAQRLHT